MEIVYRCNTCELCLVAPPGFVCKQDSSGSKVTLAEVVHQPIREAGPPLLVSLASSPASRLLQVRSEHGLILLELSLTTDQGLFRIRVKTGEFVQTFKAADNVEKQGNYAATFHQLVQAKPRLSAFIAVV